MILVVGATGLVGAEVCRRLALRKHPVRAMVRTTSSAEKVDGLRACGAEIVTGDLKDPASLRRAAEGAATVITTASSTLSRQPGDSIASVDHDGQLALVEASRKAGADRFIFVSFRDNPETPNPLTAAKRAVENAIRDLNFTSIQASFFMEVWLSPAFGFDFTNAKARVYGSGEHKISWISYRDVAEFCVAAVENPAARHRILEAGGPQPLSLLEVIEIFERESGRRFQVEHIPEAVLRQQYEAAGDDPLQKSFAALMLGFALGDAMDMAPVLREFPISLTSVRDYARQVLPRGATTA
jgi:uncharacterized protein YbjT (DUF2867 family)